MSATKDFKNGVLFWIKGWRHLFRHRPLLMVATLPLFISLTATTGLVFILWSYMPGWVWEFVLWFGASFGRWQNFLYYPLLISGVMIVLLASIYAMYLLQALVSVPFYSYLADRTLSEAGKKSADSRVWKEWAAHTFRMVRVSVVKTIFLLFIGLGLFVFSFMPLLNLVALVGALLILALDCMDYSLEALGFGFRRRIGYFVLQWPQWFGMALGLGLTLPVPGLTLLIIPGAIVGAALIVKNKAVAP